MKKLLLAIITSAFCLAYANAQIDTTVVIYSWKLDNHFDNKIRVPIDTSLDGFEQDNPIFRDYTSASTLGNFGSPSISNVFNERDFDHEFVFMNSFYPYMKLIWNTNFINTHKPFTKLTYTNGGSSTTKGELLDVFHSQNLTKNLNVGLNYTTFASLGQYNLQRVKNNAIRLFGSLTGTIYSFQTCFNVNSIVADENGGVGNDAFITDSTSFTHTKDIPTLFGGVEESTSHQPDVSNEVKNFSFFAVQEISFRSKTPKIDTSALKKKIRIFYPKLAYIFYVDRYKRRFNDIHPTVGLNEGLYDNIYVDTLNTKDSLYYMKIYNAARLQFQGKKTNHYFVEYGYELMKYSMYTPSQDPAKDSLIRKYWSVSQVYKMPSFDRGNKIYNSFLSSGFSKTFLNHVELKVYGQYFLSGYRAGDYTLQGELRLFTGKSYNPNQLVISATNELKKPDYLFSQYISNYFIWTNHFRQTALGNLSTVLTVSSKKFELKGDYYLFRNFVFFNDKAMPDQYGRGLSVLVLDAEKRFDFWKISSINKLVYQKTSDINAISLPELAFKSSTYFTKMINFKSTGGKLLTMLGLDIFYNTKYYANAYMPSLATFYQQHQKQLGNYPYIDAYLNVQLKRARFFFKFEHVNSGWLNKDYFTILHYPRNERYFKFGISWTFYD